MAARSTFSTSGATPFLVKATVSSASPTRRPLISSSTRRAFCGDTRWNFASARNSCVSSCIGFFLNLLNRDFHGSDASLRSRGVVFSIGKPRKHLLLRCTPTVNRLAGLGRRLGSLCRVTLKRSGGGKLAQLVPDHV